MDSKPPEINKYLKATAALSPQPRPESAEAHDAKNFNLEKAGRKKPIANHDHFINRHYQEGYKDALEAASNKLDELHQGTEGAGFVHYGEMGEWFDDQLDNTKGKNDEQPTI